MSRTLNMQRVAEAAGVSKSSVSLALRDDPRLAASTRRRVQEVAARLGYRKNPIVASLMSQLRVSQTPRYHANLALINCSPARGIFDDPSFAEYLAGIRGCTEKAGFGVEEFWAADPSLSLVRLRQILTARNIRGVILAVPFERRHLLAASPDFFRDFAVAAIGLDRTEPVVARAANNHFETARAAVQTMLEWGYERPGIVLRDELDRLLQRRYSAGFFSATRDIPGGAAALPAPLLLPNGGADRVSFLQWLETEKPDGVVTHLPCVRTWLSEAGVHSPEQVGLVHLDWTRGLADWAGMNQNGKLIGAAVAELVIDQLAHNEFGLRPHPKFVLVESDFVPGPSVRRRLPRPSSRTVMAAR